MWRFFRLKMVEESSESIFFVCCVCTTITKINWDYFQYRNMLILFRTKENEVKQCFSIFTILTILESKKKLFWKRQGTTFGSVKMVVNDFQILFSTFNSFMMTQGLNWYLFRHHTTSQSDYKIGKRRKVRFSQNGTPIIL